MLVRFNSKVGALTMFGDVALHLLRLMGHSGTIPGALLAQDIPGALERLSRALEQGALAPPTAADESEPGEGELPVSLRQRAYPLMELMQRAARQGADLLWDRG